MNFSSMKAMAEKAASAAVPLAVSGATTLREQASAVAAKATTYVETSVIKKKPEKTPEEVEAELAAFRSALISSHVANVEAFLQVGTSVDFYPRPGAAKVDTGVTASARRLAPLALKALDAVGYGEVVFAANLAMNFTGVVALLLTPTFAVFAERVLPMLKRHAKAAGLVCSSKRRGAVEAELALRLYYLGCTEAMEAMCRDPNAASAPTHAAADEEALARLGEWLGPAQWLYAAYKLPPPHDQAEWAAWYASQLAQRSGWTPLACVGARPCPGTYRGRWARVVHD